MVFSCDFDTAGFLLGITIVRDIDADGAEGLMLLKLLSLDVVFYGSP